LIKVDDRRASTMRRETTELEPAMQQAIATTTLVAMARDPQIDTAKLQALIDLQERMEAREAKRAYVQALALFKAACPAVLSKDGVVDFSSQKGRTHYRHTTIGHLVDTVTPHLSRYGLNIGWGVVQLEGMKGPVKVRTTLTHVLGHSESVELEGPRDESGNKNPIQSVGSACTHALAHVLRPLQLRVTMLPTHALHTRSACLHIRTHPTHARPLHVRWHTTI
jgi:hypothetical protein